MRWLESKPLMNIPSTSEQVDAGLRQRGGALLDHMPFLVKLVIEPALGSPLPLLTDIVQAAGERMGRLGQRSQPVVEGGGSFDAAIFSREPLDKMLASLPDGAAMARV